MSLTSRATIPEEFYDITSDKLLVAPRPKYLLGTWFLDSMQLSLPNPTGLGLPFRMINGQGAPYTQFDQDALVLAAALPSSLLATKADFKGQPGNTMRFNRPKFVSSTYTEASRKVGSGQTISSAPLSLQSEQTFLTLFRFSGPYGTDDSGATGIRPYGIERFDASMGVHDLVSMHSLHLQDDFHQFCDYQFLQLSEAGKAIYPQGMTADNDAPAVDSYPFSLVQLSTVEEDMDNANLPTLPDGMRVLVATPTQWRQLKHDPQYRQQAEFFQEYNLLYGRSYKGSVGKFHIFTSTTLFKPLNSSSIPVSHGIAFAPGAFLGGTGEAPYVAPHTDDNYGLIAKVVWIACLGFGLADVNFVRSVRSA